MGDHHRLGDTPFTRNAMDRWGEHVARRDCFCKPKVVTLNGRTEVIHK